MTLRKQRRTGGQRHPRRLLLAGVLGVAIIAGSGSLGREVAATSTSQAEPMGGFPSLARPIADLPPVATLSEPTPGGQGRRPSGPAGQTDSDVESAGPTFVATMPASAPVRVQIPSIGVDSDLVDLGLQTDGTLEVPSGGFPAGWYTGAPTPGELGPAIIAGHVDWGGRPGVFFDLREVEPGDEIAIIRQDGSTARFHVTRVEQFDKDAFPSRAVYGDIDHAGLRLITCGGSFDPQLRSYEDNLVVFAELVAGETANGIAAG